MRCRCCGLGIVSGVHIVLATDADWIVDEITAALGGPDTRFTVCRDGRVVSKVVTESEPDLVIVDLQVGSMGGMAITMDLRLDESGGLVDHADVLMLLDRQADVYLAQRCGAEGWLIKPIDALRLQRAVAAIANGERVTEGVPATVPVDEAVDDDPTELTDAADTPEEEPAPAG